MTRTVQQTDRELKTAIVDEFEWAPNIVADRIGVAVNDGAVTLSGEVNSYPDKTAAVKAALRVHGVTALADEIEVKSAWTIPLDEDLAREAGAALNASVVLDEDLAREAGAALNASVVLDEGSVKATVHDHQVDLTGTVGWNHQREAAQSLVSNLAGVRAVHNRIAIAPTLTFSSSDAKLAIEAALQRHAQLDADRITVLSQGTVIELTGTVRSWSEFGQAGLAAWAAPGVTHVNNHLTVLSDR